MNIAATSTTCIPMAWHDYVNRNYDAAVIPWNRYRYSGTEVVEVSPEAIHNHWIAQALRALEQLPKKREPISTLFYLKTK